MVHSVEWTTSLGRKDGKGPKPRGSRGASGPLRRVDHWLRVKRRKRAKIKGFKESQWSTPSSGPLARGERTERGQEQGIQAELVDHFKEWTTG